MKVQQKNVNFYLRMYLLVLSLSLTFELTNFTLKNSIHTWVLSLCLYSMIMIYFSKNNKEKSRGGLFWVLSCIISLGVLIFLAKFFLYQVIYILYVLTIILLLTFYLKFFKLNNLGSVILGAIPYIVSIIIIFKGIMLNINDYMLQIVIVMNFYPIIYLDRMSWEFKEGKTLVNSEKVVEEV